MPAMETDRLRLKCLKLAIAARPDQAANEHQVKTLVDTYARIVTENAAPQNGAAPAGDAGKGAGR